MQIRELDAYMQDLSDLFALPNLFYFIHLIKVLFDFDKGT